MLQKSIQRSVDLRWTSHSISPRLADLAGRLGTQVLDLAGAEVGLEAALESPCFYREPLVLFQAQPDEALKF